ncbi:hypothetical protein HKCCE3408_06005 [Rhodobacterales bacterium HKCCE3408]|nr:hypothetical protein [Rhodobacterales bacterium HKCCE3408]
MTMNTIAFILLLAAIVVALVLARKSRVAEAQRIREHRPHAPGAGHDQGSVARSISSGYTGSGGDGA